MNFKSLIGIFLLLVFPLAGQAEDYYYTVNGSNITISGYTGPGGAVVIPSNIVGRTVTSIARLAFWGCNSLTSVAIPGTITNVEDRVFLHCTNLVSAAILDGITSIGYAMFSGCASLTGVTIPNSVTNIGERAFSDCGSLTSIIIPAGVTNIGSEAFNGCASLTSIIIPAGVTNIGSGAFHGCASLTSITIPSSVISIGNDDGGAFWDCTNLLAISVDANNPAYSGASGVLFNKDKTVLFAYPGGKTGSYTIPDSVTGLGFAPFAGRLGLSAITVGTNNSAYSSLNGVLFNKNQTALIAYPGGKAGSYTIPSNVTGIGFAAFAFCPSLTGITIPGSITGIGDYAFMSCTNLPSIVIPDSVTSIGDSALSCCSSLFSITVDTNNVFYSSVDGVLFNKTKAMLVQYPAGKIGSYTVPDMVTDIKALAFDSCTNLTSIIFGNNVTNIGQAAFVDCTSLTSVTIPASVKTIGDSAFQACNSLISVTIPASVAVIGEAAFSDCDNLTAAYFQGDIPAYVGQYVFSKASRINLTTVYYLPETTGWGTWNGGCPARAWNPKIQTGDTSFGVRSNRFGFTITGATNFAVKVEACTNLTDGVWEPVQTATLNDGSFSFSDPQSTNYPGRFYRLQMP